MPVEQILTLMPQHEDETWFDEMVFGGYTEGRWGWFLEDAVAFPEPIAFKGQQSILWPLPESYIALVDEQIARARSLTLRTTP
jgi:hypothetical protein